MKASVNTSYGPPEVLSIKEVEKPQPKDNEVLVKIHATTVNRTDTGFRNPEYFLVRIFGGFFKPRYKILGTEFSGEIEAIGKNVKLFKSGDAVFGLNTFTFGTHAEYICIKENKTIALKPTNMNFHEAAAVCDGLMLGLNFVRNMDYSKKNKILVNGATGSIGTAVTQLAKYYGAEVTAVYNTKNKDLIKSLGADSLIDYLKEDFTKSTEQYDFIFDTVGKSSFFKCKHLLKPKGVYISSELGYLSQNVFLALWSLLFGNKKVKFPIPTDSKIDLLLFKEIIESGKYKAVIDKTYTLENIIEATKYVETGEKTGNVVISIL
jgi:NADPH:quinone reductase-like Zn-dependent oxidoreductase